jgi:lipoate---protein ligase
MYFHHESLSTPEENLAFDEALVETAESISIGESGTNESAFALCSASEVLRVWELKSPCVVLGRASKWNEEVDEVACLRDGVPVLRRASGGASIVAGPGCLMYSVLISYQHRPAWRGLDVAHQQVMSRVCNAVQRTVDIFQLPITISIQGTCDLTIDGRKLSGNALRCKRNWMLYHGTILYSMPLEWLSLYLREPPRQPVYRQARVHGSFVTNVLDTTDSVNAIEFRQALERQLAITWEANQPWLSCPLRHETDVEAKRLLTERYTNHQWHRSR